VSGGLVYQSAPFAYAYVPRPRNLCRAGAGAIAHVACVLVLRCAP
jgi:hypothetical protein